MALKVATVVDRIPAALIALWSALPELENVPITDGVPPPGTFNAPAWVAITDVEGTQEVRAMDVTNRPRLEVFEQEVLVSVARATRTDTSSSVVARAFELFVALADAIRDNPTLAGVFTGDGQIQSIEVGRYNLLKRQTDQERSADLVVTLIVRARI